MLKAPIALFVYKRPQHTEKTLESLSRCEGADESDLFVFCDGPKRTEDEKAVAEVRQVVRGRRWCRKVNIIEREKNMGLANSIIGGVTELCNSFGRVIVLEDDLLTSRYFLDYMNRALDLYEKNERVMQVSGHMFPVNMKPETDAFFLPFTTSWGWATWQRAWSHFDGEMKGYTRLKKDKALKFRFDLDRSYPYFNMLSKQRRGKVDSWAIRWYLSVFMRNGLTLYPSQTLIQNIGFDGSGTHSSIARGREDFPEVPTDFKVLTFPEKPEVAGQSFVDIKEYLRSRKRSLPVNIVKGIVFRLTGKYCL